MTVQSQVPRPFTHRVFVDFSGDDGDSRTPGSSQWLTVSWVISEEGHIRFNEGIVLQMKNIIGCKAGNELKYRSLKRHRKKEDCLDLLAQLKVKVVLMCVEKRSITEQDMRDPGTKHLVAILHTLPFGRVIRVLPDTPEPYFQLVMDEVSWRSCEADIIVSFKQDMGLDWSQARPDWLRFAKSGGDLMIQLADVLAGVATEYMETLPAQRPPCRQVCQPHNRIIPCRYVRKGLPVGQIRLLRKIWPLLAMGADGKVWDTGLIMRPPTIEWPFMFLHCLRPRTGTKR